MTAPTKPTIDEQIEYQKELGYKDEYRAAILSTLRAHKAIMEAKRPEPVAYWDGSSRIIVTQKERDWDARTGGTLAHGRDKPLYGPDLLDYADRIRAERDDLQRHCDRLTGVKFSERIHAAIVSRAETAERQLTELQAKHDALVKDAERYRFIRDQRVAPPGEFEAGFTIRDSGQVIALFKYWVSADKLDRALDAAIDAAMSAVALKGGE